MRFGIRAQLLVPLVPLVLGLAATTAWTAYSAATAARQQIFDDLAHVADTVRQVTFPRNAQTLRLMKSLSRAELLVTDALGQPLLDDQGQPLTTLATLPKQLPEPTETGEPAKMRVGDIDYLCRGVRLQHDRLYFFVRAEALDDAVARAVRPALVIGGVGGAAAILLALWGTQRLTRRIQDIQRRTQLIAAGDFSPMPLSPRRDELHDLGQAINDMAQQLSNFQETLRSTERLRLLGQVSGGLAHQLRNGIAGAKLALQVLKRSWDGSEADNASLAVALRQLALMENYLKRFFDLGKAIETRRETVDLAGLIDETTALLRPQCVHEKIDLNIDIERVGPIVGDGDQFRQVLFNLTTNAIEAAGPGGRVVLRLAAGDPAGDTITLDVVDSGPGVATEVAGKLFEPFVTGKREGVGLGLAVARQIVEAHGGTLTWSRVSDASVVDGAEATRFRVQLYGRA